MKKTTVNAMDVINSSPIFEKENLEMGYIADEYAAKDSETEDSEECCSDEVLRDFLCTENYKSEEEIEEDFRKAVLAADSGMGKAEIVTLPNGKKAYGTVVSEGFIERKYVENDLLYAIDEIRAMGYSNLEDLRLATEHLYGERNTFNVYARALRNALYLEVSTRHVGRVHNLTTKVVTELISVVDYISFALLFRQSFFEIIHSKKLKTSKDVYNVMMKTPVSNAIIDYARKELKKVIETSSCAPIGNEEDGFTLEDTEAFAVEDRYDEEILTIATKDFLKKISTRKGFKPDSTAFRVFKAKAYFCLRYNVLHLDTKTLATLLGVSVQSIYDAQDKINLLYTEFASFIAVEKRRTAS